MIEALDVCLEEVLSGRKSLEDCLDEHTEIRSELEPLLKVAVAVARLAQDEPSAMARNRSRMRLQSRLLECRVTPRRRLDQLWFHALRAAAVLLVVIVAGGGTAIVAASSLPNDAIYPLKLAIEQAEVALARSPEHRAAVHVALAARRLEEIQALQAQGRTLRNNLALESLGRDTELGLTLGRDLEDENSKTRIMERLVILTERQQSVLQRVMEDSPPGATSGLTRAMEASRQSHEQAMSVLKEKSERGGDGPGGRADSPQSDEATTTNADHSGLPKAVEKEKSKEQGQTQNEAGQHSKVESKDDAGRDGGAGVNEGEGEDRSPVGTREKSLGKDQNAREGQGTDPAEGNQPERQQNATSRHGRPDGYTSREHSSGPGRDRVGKKNL